MRGEQGPGARVEALAGVSGSTADLLLASSQSGGDLAHLAPADALALIPHASALLMDDLKRLCEAVLVAAVDEENAAALLDVAERCFAVRLKATCADVLRAA